MIVDPYTSYVEICAFMLLPRPLQNDFLNIYIEVIKTRLITYSYASNKIPDDSESHIEVLDPLHLL